MSEAQANNNRSIRRVLGKWRKAVSLTEDVEEGKQGIYLHRFDKEKGRWLQLLYFKSIDDFEEFLEFLEDTVFGEEEAEEEASFEDD